MSTDLAAYKGKFIGLKEFYNFIKDSSGKNSPATFYYFSVYFYRETTTYAESSFLSDANLERLRFAVQKVDLPKSTLKGYENNAVTAATTVIENIYGAYTFMKNVYFNTDTKTLNIRFLNLQLPVIEDVIYPWFYACVNNEWDYGNNAKNGKIINSSYSASFPKLSMVIKFWSANTVNEAGNENTNVFEYLITGLFPITIENYGPIHATNGDDNRSVTFAFNEFRAYTRNVTFPLNLLGALSSEKTDSYYYEWLKGVIGNATGVGAVNAWNDQIDKLKKHLMDSDDEKRKYKSLSEQLKEELRRKELQFKKDQQAAADKQKNEFNKKIDDLKREGAKSSTQKNGENKQNKDALKLPDKASPSSTKKLKDAVQLKQDYTSQSKNQSSYNKPLNDAINKTNINKANSGYLHNLGHQKLTEDDLNRYTEIYNDVQGSNLYKETNLEKLKIENVNEQKEFIRKPFTLNDAMELFDKDNKLNDSNVNLNLSDIKRNAEMYGVDRRTESLFIDENNSLSEDALYLKSKEILESSLIDNKLNEEIKSDDTRTNKIKSIGNNEYSVSLNSIGEYVFDVNNKLSKDTNSQFNRDNLDIYSETTSNNIVRNEEILEIDIYESDKKTNERTSTNKLKDLILTEYNKNTSTNNENVIDVNAILSKIGESSKNVQSETTKNKNILNNEYSSTNIKTTSTKSNDLDISKINVDNFEKSSSKINDSSNIKDKINSFVESKGKGQNNIELNQNMYIREGVNSSNKLNASLSKNDLLTLKTDMINDGALNKRIAESILNIQNFISSNNKIETINEDKDLDYFNFLNNNDEEEDNDENFMDIFSDEMLNSISLNDNRTINNEKLNDTRDDASKLNNSNSYSTNDTEEDETINNVLNKVDYKKSKNDEDEDLSSIYDILNKVSYDGTESEDEEDEEDEEENDKIKEDAAERTKRIDLIKEKTIEVKRDDLDQYSVDTLNNNPGSIYSDSVKNNVNKITEDVNRIFSFVDKDANTIYNILKDNRLISASSYNYLNEYAMKFNYEISEVIKEYKSRSGDELIDFIKEIISANLNGIKVNINTMVNSPLNASNNLTIEQQKLQGVTVTKNPLNVKNAISQLTSEQQRLQGITIGTNGATHQIINNKLVPESVIKDQQKLSNDDINDLFS